MRFSALRAAYGFTAGGSFWTVFRTVQASVHNEYLRNLTFVPIDVAFSQASQMYLRQLRELRTLC